MKDNFMRIDTIFINMMTRYEALDQLIPFAFQGYDSTELNIFIDLYSIYHTMYSREFRTIVNDYREFTVLMIDLCAHYRTYFRYIGVKTNIFLIHSYNVPKNILSEMPNYNKTMQDKLRNNVVKDMVTTNVELLKVLCPYLPDIHFIETEFESSVLMYELIQREKRNPSLIISKDIYPIQLTTLFDNVAYLYPQKRYSRETGPQDVSCIICPKSNKTHRESFWHVIAHKTGNIAREDIRGSLSTSNQVLIESMNLVKDRDIAPCIINISTSVKMIYDTITGQEIALTPDYLLSIPKFKYTDDLPVIKKRFAALNVVYQYEYFRNSIEKIKLHYENLVDPHALEMINSSYFKDNPLDLLRL